MGRKGFISEEIAEVNSLYFVSLDFAISSCKSGIIFLSGGGQGGQAISFRAWSGLLSVTCLSGLRGGIEATEPESKTAQPASVSVGLTEAWSWAL